jgi:hypothetical protein
MRSQVIKQGTMATFAMRNIYLIFTFSVLFAPNVVRAADASLWWENVNLAIHRNGEPDPCALFEMDLSSEISDEDDKYKIESWMTDFVAESIIDKSSCTSLDNHLFLEGILGFCDMGKEHTPVLLDHSKLVNVKGETLPCHWHTREGLRISSLQQL